jgi:hypothetical protein
MKVMQTWLISYVNVFPGETVCAAYIMVPQPKVPPHCWRTVTFTYGMFYVQSEDEERDTDREILERNLRFGLVKDIV